MAKNKLGQGLGAIFGDEDISKVLDDIQNNAKSESTVKIKLVDIHANPYQPRKVFDEQAIDELAESIKLHGVFTPILVRNRLNGGYELIAGERRYRAAKKAGLSDIPAIIHDFNDTEMMEIAILENIQRENLSAIEEANGYSSLMNNLGYTQEEVAKRVGKSRVYVTNLLRLLKLPVSIQDDINNGAIPMGSARALLSLDNEDDQLALAALIKKQGLSTREVERRVKEMSEGKPEKKAKPETDPFVSDLQNQLSSKLSTKVIINKHNVTINYEDNDDLNRILEILGCLE